MASLLFSVPGHCPSTAVEQRGFPPRHQHPWVDASSIGHTCPLTSWLRRPSLERKTWGALPSPANASECKEWRNNASQVALTSLLPVTKVRSNARRAGRSLAFKTRWRMCFSVFRTSRSRSFVFMQTFFLLLTDKIRAAVKVISLLIWVQFIFFHALWMAIFLRFFFFWFFFFFLLQSAVADDVGHLILFECSVNLRESKNKKQKKNT